MNRLTVAGWVFAAALAGALIAGTYSNRVGAQGSGSYGWWGPAMMAPGMMGPGMRGHGWGPWGQQGNLNLSANDVKGYLERWIAMAGNPRIKVGNVSEKDVSMITADIVTTDEEVLVQRFSVDRRTGFLRSVE